MPDPDKETAKWKASFAWRDVQIDVGRAIMSMATFLKLADYSCTIPDGVYIGKRWRRREPYVDQRDGSNVWFMGEYAEHADPKRAAIIWREIWWVGRGGTATERATNAAVTLHFEAINARAVEKALG